jgi:dTDP-4-amino-4,6-dideoxygalactose transaminase
MTTSKIHHFGLKRQYNNLKEQLALATHDALKEGIFVGGPQTEIFESWLRNITSSAYAVVTHSGTQALEIIARYEYSQWNSTANITISTPNITIPNLTYPATLNAFMSTGWTPRLVDVDKNGLMDYTDDEDIFGPRSCFVGLYGATTDRTFDHRVIVDGAQHWLADPANIGMAMAISFDPTKNLNASGNGGAIVTDNLDIYEFALNYRNNGGKHHHTPGTNSKMSELDCAHLMVRTRYIAQWQLRRKKIRHYYLDRFENLPVRCLSRDMLFHMDQKFVVYTPENRDNLNHYLTEAGIETKIHYPYALSELPIAKNLIKPDFLSTSVMLTRGVLSLPIYPELTDSEIEYIADKVCEFYA